MSEAVLPVPDVTDVELAFPANAERWTPPMGDIPDEFKNFNDGTEWNRIVSQWFFRGLPETVKFYPRDGVDPRKAVRAIQATLGCFGLKHEHKEAAAAYMLASWFKRVEGWEPA